jgi:hypothetical protein
MLEVTYYKMYTRLSNLFWTNDIEHYCESAMSGYYLPIPINYKVNQAAQLKQIFKHSIENNLQIFKKQKYFHPIGIVVKATIDGKVYLGSSVKSPKDHWDLATGLHYAWEDLKASSGLVSLPELINGIQDVQ